MEKPLWECETETDRIAAMQSMIDNGTAWKMEGSIGREAMSYIEAGKCMLGRKGHFDYYGNYVPSRYEVKPGTKGSKEYCQQRQRGIR